MYSPPTFDLPPRPIKCLNAVQKVCHVKMSINMKLVLRNAYDGGMKSRPSFNEKIDSLLEEEDRDEIANETGRNHLWKLKVLY